MTRSVLPFILSVLVGCAGGGIYEDPNDHGKGESPSVTGLAILELKQSGHGIRCTASFLTPTVLLTTASCLEFKTEQGDLGRIQNAQTGEFRTVDTIWSISAPNEPGDLGLVRLSQPPSNVTVFKLKPNRSDDRISPHFGATQCEVGQRTAETQPINVPLATNAICPGGAGGVVFDNNSRHLHSLHIGTLPTGVDQYTDLNFYAPRIVQATADIIQAPLPTADTATSTEADLCAAERRYNNGTCDEDCPLADPDCQRAETDAPPCQQANEYLDGQCPENCSTDPDCLREQNSGPIGDPCEAQGLYNNGQCDSCPQLDPDCQAQSSGDFCEEQNLYGNGVCNRCPERDPDCAVPETEQTNDPQNQQTEQNNTDLCAILGAYGNGICDWLCPRPDPDCKNDNANNTQTESRPEQTEQTGNSGTDSTSGTGGTNGQSQSTESSTDSELCALLGWYEDDECDNLCRNHDPVCRN